jgi:hypothetical protein
LKPYRRLLWFVARGVSCIFLLSWVYWGFLENEYVYRPRVPHPELGWTTPHAVKGITVYISPHEEEIVTWLYRIDAGVFAVIVIYVILGGKIDPRPPKST